MKLAVFLPNWVGDAVMATPALRALRAGFPQAELVGVARPVIAEVLDGAGLLDRVVRHHPRGPDARQRGWPLIRRLRAERFETAVLFPNSLRSAWLAWLSGARRRVGFARDARGWLLTDRLTPKPKSTPHPVLDEYLRLAEKLGCPSDSRRLSLAVSRADQAALDEFWRRHPGAWRSQGYVCFNTGGAFGPAKNWPREAFAELARLIVDGLGKAVLIVCGPAERDDARRIAAAAGRPQVVSLAEVSGGIGLTKAVVRESELLVTTDSGPRHFAAAFDVPVITLFGPTHIAWSETYYPRAVHLQLAVECGPCQQRSCPLGHHRCMQDLSVAQVWEAVQRMFSVAQRLTRAA